MLRRLLGVSRATDVSEGDAGGLSEASRSEGRHECANGRARHTCFCPLLGTGTRAKIGSEQILQLSRGRGHGENANLESTLSRRENYFLRQICPSAFSIQIDGPEDESGYWGLASPGDMALFCFAKHSCFCMRLPGGSVWSVTKKENWGFLPWGLAFSFIGQAYQWTQTNLYLSLEQVIEFVVSNVLQMANALNPLFRLMFSVLLLKFKVIEGSCCFF